MDSPAPPSAPPSRIHQAEPNGLVLFMLFFGSLIAAALIGVWLWNSNASVQEGRAFGTANQVSAIVAPPAGGGGSAGGGADAELVAKGQQLANQFGCLTCHSVTGQQIVGPTWKGLAGSQRTLANGQTVTADDAYLRESITSPDAKTVRGFAPGQMSAVVGQFESELQKPENLDALVAYIKSVK